MRISDCSSDVCSSDLLVAEEGVGADAEVLLHREGGEHRLAARELHKSGGHPLLGGSAGDVLAVEVDLDRKSVVSGKRALVRVDRGGRRFMKKKYIDSS